MTKKQIVVADDEQDIVELVSFNLEQEGFSVIKAGNGRKALELIRAKKPDLVILDLMMPEMNGMDVCRVVRGNAETADIPIIMLTAKADPLDKILGLEIGADDYITKPFHVREMIARVRSVLRRSERKAQLDVAKADDDQRELLACGGIQMDLGSYRVTLDGKPVELSSREFKLLHFFIFHPGRVYSRDQLLDRVWGDEAFVEPRTVDVHISRLRSVIEPDKENPRYILTVRGIGYKFAES
ncbi:MAG: winged helix-turn-helix domain-containing protein [Syntrophales bacterium]|jgi:phosphate regulon transcriptional regulator PhoB|nr:winged helix-turn-helix domain-containing protein [Syntrophales bacterium]